MDEAVLLVRTEHDAAEAARAARTLAEQLGLGSSAAVQLATAVSELAMNQVRHAGGTGTIRLAALEVEGGAGVSVEASDEGPGIPDVDLALQDGHSTTGTLGLGLGGARRLVDEFRVQSGADGTVVTLVKWSGAPPPDPDRLAAWAIAGPGADAAPVVKPFPGGLLLGVVHPDCVEPLKAEPDHAVARFLDSGSAGAVAVVAARDGALTWARAGTGCAMRLAPELHAPPRRAATIPVHSGAWLVLGDRPCGAGAALLELAGGGPGRVAGAAAAAGGPRATAIAARVLRGALERPARG